MAIDLKGLVREFILIITLYCLDIGTEFGCFSEIHVSRIRYQKWLLPDANYQHNYTAGFGVCKSSDWDKEEFEAKVNSYAALTDAYLFFLIISGCIFICYALAYIWFVLRAWYRSEYIAENRQSILRIKFFFGFLLSFALDIPGSCMAVVLYSMRYGERGLHCWDCAQDVTRCTKKQELEHRQYISELVIVLMFLTLLIVSIWKGITTFYRWSKTDKVDCWQLRGCVALFVGAYYVVIILTPALGIFKYMFFRLPSQVNNVFAEFTNSLFMIGMLGWIIFMVVGCCYPLLKCIRVGSPTGILTGKNENVWPGTQKTNIVYVFVWPRCRMNGLPF